MSTPLDIHHECYQRGRQGMGGKRIIHRIILVRHGETSANNSLMSGENITSHSLDTPLTERGQQQGHDVARYLFNELHYSPDEIIYSALDRAHKTAAPSLAAASAARHNQMPTLSKCPQWAENNYKTTETLIDHDNVEWVYRQESHDQFVRRVFNSFESLRQEGSPDSPKQTLVFTHSQVINTILTSCLSSEISSHPSAFFFHLSNGSLTCIDVDECGQCHVHAVNFTKHLTCPTGQHSPFV
mmetsp:Transcript_30818/g.57468  ORF Transcript_30818/g.57468 Transcript_30818/m.57468 type:complete len:242 (+) Transcript_30818:3-728(+)